MNTPSLELPQPKIKEPLSFRPVKRSQGENKKTQYLDAVLKPSFLKAYLWHLQLLVF